MQKSIKYFNSAQIITLFDCHKQKTFRGVLYINSKLISFNIFLKRLSILSLIISLVGFVSIISPAAFAVLHSKFSKAPVIDEIPATAKETAVTDSPVIQGSVILSTVPISNEFKIYIPKIGLESDIVPNVDTTSEEIYKQKLQYGVAHANGSYFPGQEGMVFLFAHSTDSIANMLVYNAKFMDIYQLDIGDVVHINYQGKLYQYNISDKQVINPQDVELVRQTNSNLVLSTCWPLGTNWQRLVLFAQLIDS